MYLNFCIYLGKSIRESMVTCLMLIQALKRIEFEKQQFLRFRFFQIILFYQFEPLYQIITIICIFLFQILLRMFFFLFEQIYVHNAQQFLFFFLWLK